MKRSPMRTDSYALVDPQKVVRERGNKKDMHRKRRAKGKGWVVYLTNKPIGDTVP